MSSSAERVLIYRLGSLGDTTVALPAFHLIARAFPNADRRLLTNFPIHSKAPAAGAILENTGLIHGYIPYTVGTRNPLQLLSLWWQIRRWRPQVLVYLAARRGIEAAHRDARFFRACGVSRQIGVPLTEAMQQHQWLASTQALESESSRLARNISALGDARLDDPASWNLHLTSAEYARASAALAPLNNQPFIAACTGTKMQANDWGRDNWRTLFARLTARYPTHALVLCGAREDRETSDFAVADWNQSPSLNLCGQLTPRETAAVFSRATLYLGHDSGPMHLAAAVQTPCLAIFSARNKPRVWFPYGSQHRVIYHQTDCWGCKLETCIVQKKKCIASITVDEVLSHVTLG